MRGAPEPISDNMQKQANVKSVRSTDGQCLQLFFLFASTVEIKIIVRFYGSLREIRRRGKLKSASRH